MPIIVVLIVFVSLCYGLGRLPLQQPDEGRNAEVAREMKESRAWLVPTYNGVAYLDKPAFFFKAVALSLAAFGDNETAARLPSALFALALVALVFTFCWRVYGLRRVAWLAAMIVATMPLYLALARLVIFDMTLAFFVCAAIFAGFLAEEMEGPARRNWYLLGAAAAGFATLVKGPVGFFIPLLVLLVTYPLTGRRGAWRRLFAPLNLLVFFAITLPWFIGLCLKRPDFLHYGLVEESLNRFTSTKTFHRGRPVYYYAIIVAATFFPWSLLLPEAMVAMWKRRGQPRHRADLLCLVWSVVVIGFFSVSRSKMPGYVVSVCVASGILLARLLAAALTAPQGYAVRLLRRGMMGFLVVCLAALAAVVWVMVHPERLGALLPNPELDHQGLLRHAGTLAVFFAVIAGLAAVGIFCRSRRVSVLCLALFSPLFIIVNFSGAEALMSPLSGRITADKLRPLPPDTELAALDCFPNGVPFYLGRTLTLISADGSPLTSNYIISMLKRSAPWPPNIVPVTELDGWLASRKTPVYLIVNSGDRQRLETIAAAHGATVQTLTTRFCGAQLPAP